MNGKKLIFAFFILVAGAAAFAEAATGNVGSQRWLLNIANIFSQNWVKGLFCLLLIGQALGIMVSSGQNQQVAKTLIATLIATGVFFIAGLIVSKGYAPSVKFGRRFFPSFNVEKVWDKPIAIGMEDFFALLYGLQSFVITLVTLACFLNIAFNCIKVWAGTQELKKMYVDIIYKSILCLLIMNFYPSLQTGAFQLATQVGAKASGGIDRLNQTFATSVLYLRKDISQRMVKVLPILVEYGSFKDKKTGKTYIDVSQLNQFTHKLEMKPEDVSKFLQENNIEQAYATRRLEDELVDKRNNPDGSVTRTKSEYGTKIENKEKVDYRDMNNNVIDVNTFSWWWQTAGRNQQKKMQKEVDKQIAEVQRTFNKLLSLSEIMTGYSITDWQDWDESERKARIKEMLDDTKELSYNPYLRDSKGSQTQILAPSSLMKTNLLMADALAMACAYKEDKLNDETPLLDENFNVKKGDRDFDNSFEDETKQRSIMWKGSMFWNGLKGALVSVFYWVSGTLCTIVAMVEYTMVVWEYALITSLATLLIPFLFLDATKSFATNLIKIFLQYFAKIMVVTIATFYVFNMYLNTSLFCYQTETSPNALACLGIYIFSSILGITFISGSEKIANVLFTGSPVMSMGDVVKGARDVGMVAGMGMRAAKGAAKTGAALVSGGVAGIQAGVRGAQTIAAISSGMAQAGKAASEGVMGSAGFTNDAQGMKMANQAARNAKLQFFGAAIGQGAKDFATKLFTGRDAQHFVNGQRDNSASFHGVGGKNYVAGQEQGTTTYAKAKDSAHKIADEIGKSAAASILNPSRKGDQSMQRDLEKPDSVDHPTKR